jgi:SsrA-binding protein
MTILVQNKKVNFDYIIIEKFLAGLQLIGTEVKSIRNKKASITEAYCRIINDEIFVFSMHVSDYKEIKHTNHEPLRVRKLLLKKKEIRNLLKSVKEKGLTIVPTSLLLSENGFIKIELALVKGKKSHDKRQSIKERDIKRELERK